MYVKKGDKLKIDHTRKGIFIAIAGKNFDTADDFYPVRLATENGNLVTLNTTWVPGEEVICKGTLCSIRKI